MATPPFLESVREYMLLRHHSRHTAHAYSYWIKYFILFCDKKHPQSLEAQDRWHFSPGSLSSGRLRGALRPCRGNKIA